MSLSPLLKFALESFEHALEQYMLGTDKSRKFSMLHCDQAIELILKDKLRALGVPIFKGNGRTIDYYDALNELTNHKGVKIPERADLELMHDLRNVIQHKGATVSKEEAEFYIKKGYDFIRRFLKEELGVALKDHLDKLYYEIFEPTTRDRTYQFAVDADRLDFIARTAALIHDAGAKESRTLISALLFIYNELATHAVGLALSMGFDKDKFTTADAVRFLHNEGVISKDDLTNFENITSARNAYAHTDKIPSRAELENSLDIVIKLLDKVKVKSAEK